MKSVIAIVVAGIIGFAATEFTPGLEMWAPLIVAIVPIVAFMMWNAETADTVSTRKKAA